MSAVRLRKPAAYGDAQELVMQTPMHSPTPSHLPVPPLAKPNQKSEGRVLTEPVHEVCSVCGLWRARRGPA